MFRQAKCRHLAVCLLALWLCSWSGAAHGGEVNDPFGAYESMDFVAIAIGPAFFAGDFADRFDTATAASLRFGLKLQPPLSLATTVDAGITQDHSDDTAVLFYALGLRLHTRLAPQKSWLHPYLEAGFGYTGLASGNFAWLAGAGLDCQIWDEGSLGLHSSLHYLPAESAYIVPVLLSFTRYF